ncbi:lipid IV(A) 3-deoxy-D-manno-octulosonic acid transferase [Pseudoalteromonas luteoviolacea]|nr:lipid IV(A) 3-deoxy-D-manno-octulosonic acid transferase [Pseudoalteromonas luteoviolacea]AOT10169.1 3-deoxy-D-manno-octulosonic acid transferase [Pseudoalteromonas luteoviolacea]AOT15081.1 3-deoxy-D-manno-octulosonic acid transferase [Pseudoalteromonas luteoviolacea]AOT19997.1 3-deoxy-D-manno-octulosonic acid transferase [Pseudoalteromonas luteoviolacea]
MTRLIYSITLILLAPLIAFYLYQIRGKKNLGYRAHFGERFGAIDPRLPKEAIIIHCASVGEVLAAAPLIKKVREQHPNDSIIVTCNTPTGRDEITKQFKDSVHVCYLPIDFGFAVHRFIKTLKPKLLLVLETELWPNLFYYANKHHCPVAVVNARLSEKSYRGYQKVASLTRLIMSNITVLASHNEEDAHRFVELGLSSQRVSTTGSIKFDVTLDAHDMQQMHDLSAQLGLRPIWIAGSTHPGEHEQIIAVHKKLLEKIPTALLIIAPRHPEQFSPVADLLSDAGLCFSRRSGPYNPNSQVLLADTLGELKFLYGCAQISFIGGSLIERGGHNPLESAASSVGVLSGPSTYNFSHIYPQLIAQQGAQICADQSELLAQVSKYLHDPKATKLLGAQAHACLALNQGAISRTLNIIDSLLEQ